MQRTFEILFDHWRNLKTNVRRIKYFQYNYKLMIESLHVIIGKLLLITYILNMIFSLSLENQWIEKQLLQRIFEL